MSLPLLDQELKVGDTLGFYDKGVFSEIYMIKKIKGFTDDWRIPLVLEGGGGVVLRLDRCVLLLFILRYQKSLVVLISLLYFLLSPDDVAR